MARIDHVGIVVNPGLKGAFRVAEQASVWLESQGVTVSIAATDPSRSLPIPPDIRLTPREAVAANADVLIVLGGDGTLLGVARTTSSVRAPILAVNLGNVGFLTSVTREEFIAELERVIAGDFETDERTMLRYEVRADGDVKATGTALNDIVIRDNAHIITLEVGINGGRAFTVRGDGLIISTPTGSTAYSVASGGPILHPDCDAFLLTPVSAFMLAMRPTVVPADSRLSITVSSETPDGVLRADGQEQFPLLEGCSIHAWRAENVISLIRSRKRDFFGVLRAKLHLGTLPRG